MSPALEIKNLTKRYGDIVALDTVSLELRRNEILGLVGQNGSGKSTLMKVINGILRPDTGQVILRGQPTVLKSPFQASRQGIGMVHQEQSLVPNLTVAENVYLNHHDGTRKMGIYNWKALFAKTQAHLHRLGLDIPPETLIEDLTFAQRQMVELAKVLSLEDMTRQDLIVLFDEATAIMSGADIEVLFSHIRRISDRASVIFVSHRMDEVLDISDRIYVLSDGKVVAERDKAETEADELYELMVGRQRVTDRRFEARQVSAAQAVEQLALRGVRCGNALKPTSLTVKKGEILGLIGVHGSGAEELCRVVFGAEDEAKGEICLRGRKINIRDPRHAVREGIGYVPAERKVEGAVLGRSVADNMCLAFGGAFARLKVLRNRRKETAVIDHWMERLGIRPRSPSALMSTLSGGNQQKAVLGKWLLDPKISLLVLDHPTRGLDPGARADVFSIVRELAEEGVSIVFVADTLDEVLLLAHRIVVMRDGEISAEFTDVQTRPPAEESLVKAMV
ncbi:sugar ABC transporter ATP-binding protein [Mesorhizobium sp. M3A.F.Ca.ET.201.01.1.1]|uniref:sugar ABC transporter ATP-binding protein n=1 Tax=Mesorhizobium sp. M3A.F.Ca.ET.201.01.1.1 TaxID=2563946 RepID=UPI001093EC4D|nr:sugar ABC transporter ATP-binding protein [Mesorhizobium sp. M3A.F.Ca.ET.201.01.1.1]TGS71709.1 sugar ABC transporter ATP-binding protein [Mesorhizobium sp. M3A.F.Ca.ET.201.01.1.1]